MDVLHGNNMFSDSLLHSADAPYLLLHMMSLIESKVVIAFCFYLFVFEFLLSKEDVRNFISKLPISGLLMKDHIMNFLKMYNIIFCSTKENL